MNLEKSTHQKKLTVAKFGSLKSSTKWIYLELDCLNKIRGRTQITKIEIRDNVFNHPSTKSPK